MNKTVFIISLLIIISISSISPARAEWQVDLEVYTQDQKSDTGNASNNLSLGTTATTTEEFDNKSDTVALLTDYVNAYFYHPEYKANVQKLWRDFRGNILPKEWEFDVQSPKTDNSINIKWNIQAPDNLHFVLIDKDSGAEIDMASSKEYKYNAASTAPKKFLLKVSDNNSVASGNDSNSQLNNSGTSSGGTSAGTKGGGCGRIKNINTDNDPKNSSGNIAMNMVILLIPLLLPFQHYLRRRALVVIKRGCQR